MATPATKKKRAETWRLRKLCAVEAELRQQGFSLIAGVDEAGRGPLAGPVVAAACLLPEGYVLRGIDDSKKLQAHDRYVLYQELVRHPDVRFGIGVVEAMEIDEHNIHQATLLAMKRAIDHLGLTPEFLLVDGKYVPGVEIPAKSIVDGDQKVQSIAGASVLAKVTRDHIMIGYDELYPEYGFKDHKGYGTKKHLDAIALHGYCPIHRMSFHVGEKHV